DHLSRPEQAGRPWRVDEMFEPEWRPRYFVYDGRGHFPSAAMAMGRAESQRPFPSVGQSATPSGTGTGTGTRGGAHGHGRGNGGHGSNGHKRARRNARDAAMDQDAATDGERRAGWKAPSSG
ncbi:MAG: hypothetical protein QOD49_2004, partial [Actinomycetota bacterium]|nr:hypothetical protein [Actinomycetota bacterium]